MSESAQIDNKKRKVSEAESVRVQKKKGRKGRTRMPTRDDVLVLCVERDELYYFIANDMFDVLEGAFVLLSQRDESDQQFGLLCEIAGVQKESFAPYHIKLRGKCELATAGVDLRLLDRDRTHYPLNHLFTPPYPQISEEAYARFLATHQKGKSLYPAPERDINERLARIRQARCDKLSAQHLLA